MFYVDFRHEEYWKRHKKAKAEQEAYLSDLPKNPSAFANPPEVKRDRPPETGEQEYLGSFLQNKDSKKFADTLKVFDLAVKCR